MASPFWQDGEGKPTPTAPQQSPPPSLPPSPPTTPRPFPPDDAFNRKTF